MADLASVRLLSPDDRVDIKFTHSLLWGPDQPRHALALNLMFKPSFQIDADLSPLENLDQMLWDLEQMVGEDLEHEDPRVASALEEIESMAHRLLDSARAFQPIGQISTLTILDTMVPIEEKARKGWLENDIAQRSLELRLLKEASARIFHQIKRLKEFIGVVRTLEMHGATRVYLEEMSALYLDGRTLSVYMIARSTLEESLKGKLENTGLLDDLLSEPTLPKRSGWPGLARMITFAHAEGILSSTRLRDEAMKLKNWGDHAVHDHNKLVESGAEPLAAIKSLSAVLKDLSRPRA